MILASLLFLCGFMFIPSKVTFSETKWTETVTTADNTAFLSLGNGSSSSPFLISKASQLATMAKFINSNTYSSSYFKLIDNIDLSQYEWNPIGTTLYSFRGVFDGGGHVISGIRISVGSNMIYAGLFGYTYNATIKNFSIEGNNSDIFASSGVSQTYAGGFVAYAQDTTLTGLSNFGIKIYAISGGTANAGGIVGYASSCNFTNVSNYADVWSYGEINTKDKRIYSYSGGIAGRAYGSSNLITYARNNGKIQAYAGGRLTYILSAKPITYAGGIVGQTNTAIKTSYNSGQIISGGSSSVIINSVTYANYLPDESYAGGIAGISENIISYVYNTGNITSIATEKTTRKYETPIRVYQSSQEIDNRKSGLTSKKMYLSYSLYLNEAEWNGDTSEYRTNYSDEKIVNAYSGGITGYSDYTISNAYSDAEISGGGIKKIKYISFYLSMLIEYRELFGGTDYRKSFSTYLSISYYDDAYFSPINGNTVKANTSSFGKNQSNLMKEMTGVNRYKSSTYKLGDPIRVGDPQANEDYGRVDYSSNNSTSTALTYTPSQNSITDNFYGDGERTYISNLKFVFNVKASGSSVLMDFYSNFTYSYRSTKNKDGWFTDSGMSYSSKVGDLLSGSPLVQSMNYTAKEPTTITTTNLGGNTYWSKSSQINSNRPHLKDFYW